MKLLLLFDLLQLLVEIFAQNLQFLHAETGYPIQLVQHDLRLLVPFLGKFGLEKFLVLLTRLRGYGNFFHHVPEPVVGSFH